MLTEPTAATPIHPLATIANACSPYPGLSLFFGLDNQNGKANWSVHVPNDPTLTGLLFTNQVVAGDPSTPTGFVLSNPAAGQVGVR